MKTTALSLCLMTTTVSGAFSATLSSSEDPLVPLPSVYDLTRGGGWGLAIGLSLEYESAYDGSDEMEFEVEPAAAIQYRKGNHMFFWEGFELGWRGLMNERLLAQAGVRYESGLEPDDSEDGVLDGLPERDSHIVGFLEARYALDDQWKSWVGGRIMGGPSDFGVLGVLAAGYRFGDRTDGGGLEIFGFTTVGSDTFVNKDFGVSAADSASSGLEEIDLDGGYRSVGLTAIYRTWITKHLHLVTQGGIEWYADDIHDSSISRRDYEAEVGTTLVWQF